MPHLIRGYGSVKAIMHPWDKRPDESGQAFAGFTTYLQLGPTRDLASAYRAHIGQPNSSKKAAGYWKRWAVKFEWQHRAAEHDLHQNRVRALAEEAAIKKETERAVRRRERVPGLEYKAGRLLMRKCIERAARDELRGLGVLMKTASDLMRRSVGLPIAEIEDKPPSMDGILFESRGQLASAMPPGVAPEMPEDPTAKPELGASVLLSGDSPLKKPPNVPRP